MTGIKKRLDAIESKIGASAPPLSTELLALQRDLENAEVVKLEQLYVDADADGRELNEGERQRAAAIMTAVAARRRAGEP